MPTDPAIWVAQWQGDIGAIWMEAAPPRIHTDPWQLQSGSPVSQAPGKGMSRYQVKKGKGLKLSALYKQLEVQALGDLPGRKSRRDQGKSRLQSYPRAQPTQPPLKEGTPTRGCLPGRSIGCRLRLVIPVGPWQ